jgi:hypothetical protein
MRTIVASPWTDVDVTRVASAIHRLDQYALTYVDCDLFATTMLDALAPRVAELQRAAWQDGYDAATSMARGWGHTDYWENEPDNPYEIERGEK